MFEKEIRKLKLLTEKLDAQGDVSEDEADWIYMFRTVFATMSIVGAEIYLQAIRNVLKDNFVSAFSYGSESRDMISKAFLDWYDAVDRHVRSSGTGNCISTVSSLPDIRVDSSLEENIRKTIYDIVFNLPERHRKFTVEDEEAVGILPLIRMGRMLSGDVYYRQYDETMHQIILSRYGLLNRLSDANYPGENTKDVNYLLSMVEKVKNGQDITEDEADDIYLVLKFAQALYVNQKIDNLGYDKNDKEKQRIKKKQVDALMGGLAVWYGTVHEAVSSGRTGNFLYTLPMNDKYNIGRAKTYIERTLKMLPPDYTVLLFTKKTDVKETPIDCYAFENISGGTTVRSYRYGGARRSGFDPGKYITIPVSGKLLNWWEKVFLRNSYHSDDCISENEKCPAIVAKLEYSRRQGVLPAGTFISQDCFVAFDKKEYEKCRYVFEIPDGEIEKLAPRVRSWDNREDAMPAVEGAIGVVGMLSSMRRDRDGYLEDDDWLEIER